MARPFHDEVWFGLDTFDIPYGIFVYNARYNAWYEFTHIGPGAKHAWESDSSSSAFSDINNPVVLLDTGTNFMRYDNTSDLLENIAADGTGGTGMYAAATFKSFNFEDRFAEYATRFLYAVYSGNGSGQAQFIVTADGGTVTTSTWANLSAERRQRFDVGGVRGTGFSVKLVDNQNGGTPWTLNSIQLEAFRLGRRYTAGVATQ
jgi:hypothetical protein